MIEKKPNWRLLLGEGFISLVFSLLLATGGSTLAYLMFSSLAERDQEAAFDINYLEAAPNVAAVVYVVFLLFALLALTRLRVYNRAQDRPRFHWALTFVLYGLIGLAPGLIFWLLLSAADRPGI